MGKMRVGKIKKKEIVLGILLHIQSFAFHLLNPLLSGSTLTLRCPIAASGGRMCDNSCSALSGRTIPFGLVCVQPFFPLR